jgi:hypothetical protein
MRLIDEVVEAPEGFLPATEMGVSVLAAMFVGESPGWGPTIAGIAHGCSLLEQVLVYTRDWVKLAPLRLKRS